MSGTILERLDKRISAVTIAATTAAGSNLDDIESLFVDLTDARTAIADAAYKAVDAGVMQQEIAALKAQVATPAPSTGAIPSVKSAHTLLIEAKERLSVNALTTVATYLDQAIELLEG
jgi:hypothetical protein